MAKIMFIDMLTTGNNPYKCGIYEMGGIICKEDNDSINILKKFNYKICPYEEAMIKDNSLWIGGVKRSDLTRYMNEEASLLLFLSMLNKIVDVHNPNDKIYIGGFNVNSFDMKFLIRFMERNGATSFRDYFYVQGLDMMGYAALSLMEKRTSMPDFHLATVAKYLGVDYENHSMENCNARAEMLMKMYTEIKKRFKLGSKKIKDEESQLVTNF